MKAVILAGGLGSRFPEETGHRPKPMIEIGGRPILWHIMKIFSAHGINDFIICAGYKSYVIKEYFLTYALRTSDVTFEFPAGSVEFATPPAENWRVKIVETGAQTQTGGRLKRILPDLCEQDDFCFTYGDGLADINISGLIAFHRTHGRLATVTTIRPRSRYGVLTTTGKRVDGFSEKPRAESDESRINGGFFVLSAPCLDLIAGDETPWEGEPIQTLVAQQELMAYQHDGFWHSMDTARDRAALEIIWSRGDAPWKIW